MKLTFQTGRVYKANIIERGDKHDQSVVYLLSTLSGEAFLVENKAGSWRVTTGAVSVSQGDPIIYSEPVVSEGDPVLSSQNVVREAVAKPKDEKPKAAKSKAAKPKKKRR